MTIFATMTDAISYVEQALGEYASDYDVEEIASEVTGWEDGQLAIVADDAEFWAVVAEHEITTTYEVVIGDEREEVADVMLQESFDTLEDAQEYFDALKQSFDFYEHDEMWLMKRGNDNIWESLDHYKKGC